MLPHIFHIDIFFIFLSDWNSNIFRLLLNRFHVIQNSKQASPTVMQTIFEHCFCLWWRTAFIQTVTTKPKLDTQSNKVPNRSLINKQKVMGMFWLFSFKIRNLSFGECDVIKAAKSFLRSNFRQRHWVQVVKVALNVCDVQLFRRVEVRLWPWSSLVYVDGLCDVWIVAACAHCLRRCWSVVRILWLRSTIAQYLGQGALV
jgi:hypothetical protein